ncbi:MAG: hypothetical protein IPO01_07520 [Chitinophagaceae bacterium]|nr:hypothetical protein [Chitinophagaceae bacterium]MBK7308773.1 hypothetical protein [Chitinophagaceae bacterium]MBK8787840.1 hypothetical protein [Chitinophagaceae bacterium]MBK9485055.1 hypothetical protein [Chitinophagaceae bacterium]MBL0201614.1 hypothetical protein [Chitinophagaceae bacterium]
MQTDGKPPKETLDNWHKDPGNWKWGWIYYNKDDKRIFPPKRNKKMGWTVNFANPISIIAIVVLFVVISLIVRYFKSI